MNHFISAIIYKNELPEKIPAIIDLECTGIIGIEMMTHFNVIFDYSRSKLYLRPNKTYRSQFEINMAFSL